MVDRVKNYQATVRNVIYLFQKCQYDQNVFIYLFRCVYEKYSHLLKYLDIKIEIMMVF